MTRMEWAIDVPQKLLQSDAILTLFYTKKKGHRGANHQKKL